MGPRRRRCRWRELLLEARRALIDACLIETSPIDTPLAARTKIATSLASQLEVRLRHLCLREVAAQRVVKAK
jgi:hypothetical protein